MFIAASQAHTVTCTAGETAELFWPRSDREHFKEFRQYRAWKHNVPFAIISKGTQSARCSNDVLKTFCLTKVKFQVWNETHLLLAIKNTAYEDSGDYSVEHVFEGIEGNQKDIMSLQING